MHSSLLQSIMNKLTTLSLILIISISISIYGATGESSPSPVLDTDEDEVKSGEDYIIQASLLYHFSSGKLSLAATGESTCPKDVVQDTLDSSLGLPLNFRPVNNTGDNVIRTSTGINVAFHVPVKLCDGSTWQMRYDGSLQSFVLTTGEEIGSDSGWFKLEAFFLWDSVYKLVYCTSEDKCGDLFILRDDLGSSKTKRRLVMPLTRSYIHHVSFHVSISKPGHTDDLRIRKLPA